MSTEQTHLHIVYIITKLELGGAQKVCLTLKKGVSNADYSTSLFAGAGGMLDADVMHDSSVVLLKELQREVVSYAIIRELKAFWSLVKELRALRTRYGQRVVVHTHSTKAGILGRWAAWSAGISSRVHTVHGFAFHPHQNWMRWLLIYSAELVTSLITTSFVCVSAHDREVGKKLFPFFDRKSVIIRAAVAMDSFCAARPLIGQRRQIPFRFGTVACFKPQKNLIDLLKAFRIVAERLSDVVCEIIGDGTQRAELEAWIAEHGLADRVILHGWRDDVPALMAEWHAFLLTSLWEGLPCAVVEARLLSLPVLAYATGGIPEVIASQRNGMLYPQGAWQDLAEGMHRCVIDPQWYEQMASHQDVLVDFHDSAMVEQHRKLYRELRDR